MGSIERMFDPETVALIGATEREGSVGRDIMENLLMGADEREIFPVNPNRETILGLKCYPSIKDVPKHVDLAIIAVPAKIVPKVVEECGEAGVDGVVIISAGFREVGGEGRKLEEEIDQIRRKYNLRVLGPNCFGFIRPHIKLNATFLRRMPEPGQIAFISQSGALGSAILDWAVASHIGFSMFISLGSMLDIDFGDLIDYLGEDPNTKSILIYMEGIEDIERARKFMSAARGFARTKSIIILKPGKHEADPPYGIHGWKLRGLRCGIQEGGRHPGRRDNRPLQLRQRPRLQISTGRSEARHNNECWGSWRDRRRCRDRPRRRDG
ncbi:MAG: CoA-binding protein [Nitrososphaeria archaeon]|nr:CoA-binding protein [Nitrososphaeria archaeon]